MKIWDENDIYFILKVIEGYKEMLDKKDFTYFFDRKKCLFCFGFECNKCPNKKINDVLGFKNINGKSPCMINAFKLLSISDGKLPFTFVFRTIYNVRKRYDLWRASIDLEEAKFIEYIGGRLR